MRFKIESTELFRVSSETFTFGSLLFFLVFLAITIVIPHIHAIVLVSAPIVVLDKVVALETVAYDLLVLFFRYGVVNCIVIRLSQRLHQQTVAGIPRSDNRSHLPLLETRSSRSSCLEGGKLVELGTCFAAFHD
jgi:hypothetical protein